MILLLFFVIGCSKDEEPSAPDDNNPSEIWIYDYPNEYLSDVLSDTILVRWSGGLSSQFQKYMVYRSLSSDVNTQSTLITTITKQDSNQIYDTNISAGIAYYYRVYSYTNDGSFTASPSKALKSFHKLRRIGASTRPWLFTGCNGIQLNQGYAYAVLGGNDPGINSQSILNVYDLTNDNIQEINSFANSGGEIIPTNNLNRLYTSYPFKVWDISVPSTPNLIGMSNSFGALLFIDQNYAYGYSSDSEENLIFHVYDISNPSNPFEIGATSPIGLGNYRISAQVVGNFLYVVTDSATAYFNFTRTSLTIIDVSNKTQPSIKNNLIIEDRTYTFGSSHLRKMGNNLILSLINQGSSSGAKFLILDLSNPTNPNLTDLSGISGNTFEYSQNMLATSDLRIFDISNLISPFMIAYSPTFDSWISVIAFDGIRLLYWAPNSDTYGIVFLNW
jgi:hypothetical protein